MDATASSKRKRSDEPSGADDEDGGDSVIGLDVGGQLFYTHKSTLTAGSAYFAARFGGTFSAGSSRKDEHGQTIYFVDADAELFKHIFAYLRRGIPSWPKDDRVMVERLVGEAEYFGVEAMLDELQILASIAPDASGKGILYWLGTNKGEEDYTNPYERDKIRLEPISDDTTNYQRKTTKLSAFFEYRPSCTRTLENECGVVWCTTDNGESRQVNFVDVMVKPTHYSLRYGSCYGMSDWNFEASEDGVSWDILHEARKERHLLQPCRDEFGNLPTGDDADFVSIAEERHRHTWEVNSSSYYKYFRFVSLTREQREALYGRGIDGTRRPGPDGRRIFSRCLHGVGFELYGDVKSATE